MASPIPLPLTAGTSRDEAIQEFGAALVGALDEIAELLFATRVLVEPGASTRRWASSRTPNR